MNEGAEKKGQARGSLDHELPFSAPCLSPFSVGILDFQSWSYSTSFCDMPSVANHPFEAYQGQEPYIFVSYSHKDGEAVFSAIGRLNQLGYRVWYDEGIDPGNEWGRDIALALKRCAYFLVFISDSAVESINVKNEIGYAFKNKKPFLAVHLFEVDLPEELDLSMSSFQAIFKWQLSEEQYYRKLGKVLPASTKKQVLQAPDPVASISMQQSSAVREAESYKYWAFISYSHADRAWADWLHRALETYRVPESLVGRESRWNDTIPKRIFPIFRDRDELPASSDLGEHLDQALRNSRFLIVICSPKSAFSSYVNEEIIRFKALGRENRVLSIVVDGVPFASDRAGEEQSECFPPAIRYRIGSNREILPERVDVVAVDMRPGQENKKTAKLKLAAGILGLNFDELCQRDKKRAIRRGILIAVCVLIIILAETVLIRFLVHH